MELRPERSGGMARQNRKAGAGRTEAQRLLWIVARLSDGEDVQIRQIIDRFRVSEATARRDLKRVEDLGYRLARTGAAPAGQFRLARGFSEHSRLLRLTKEELVRLLIVVKGALARRRATRWMNLLHRKLEILFCSSAPEAQVRLWRRITSARQDEAPAAGHAGDVALRLTGAAVESLWCELDYLALGAQEPSALRFAPHEVRGGRAYGFVEGIGRWESLELARIQAVRVGKDRFQPPRHVPAPEQWDGQADPDSGELQRVEQQLLRLIGMIRMLDRGRAVAPSRLAEVFSTTLTTVQRDMALLETAGYGIGDVRVERNRPLYHRREIGFDTVPLLPLSRQESEGLISILEHHLLHEKCEAASRVAGWLRNGQGKGAVLITVEEPVRKEDLTGKEIFWNLVEAVARRLECTVWYQAHWNLAHRFRFIPQRFLFDTPLLVRGILLPEATTRDLIFPAIFAVELHDSGGDDDTLKVSGQPGNSR